MLVWKAMPSMTLMMSAILLLLALMPFMVSTTSATTSPPWAATVDAFMASWLAVRALSAFCRTVEPSSSIDAAVSSKALACCSVRALRSLLPEAIWAEAEATLSEFWRTTLTVRTRLCCMRCKALSSWPVSSRESTSMWVVRSPPATRSATSTARARGAVMERMSQTAAAMAITMAAADTISKSARAVVNVWDALSEASMAPWWLILISVSSCSLIAKYIGRDSWDIKAAAPALSLLRDRARALSLT